MSEDDANLISNQAEQIIEVCLRSRLSRAVAEDADNNDATARAFQLTKEAAGELLDIIEQRMGSSAYIGLYGEVQRRIESSKTEKKRRLNAEAVSDPVSYAQRKAKHAAKKKESRKRKNERFAAQKGIKKRKILNNAVAFEE